MKWRQKLKKSKAKEGKPAEKTDDKARAIELAVDQIEKQFGKGSIMRLGEEGALAEIEAIPTGSLALDIALGIGGVPRGRIIEIYGPEGSGKTTLTCSIIANVQRMGGVAAFIDAEHALDIGYARKIGVDVDIKELERNLAFTRDNNNENQIITWANDGSEMLFLFPRHAIPVDAAESHMGMAYARWYASKGASGKKPDDPELLRAFDLFRASFGAKEEDRIRNGKEIWKILVDNVYSIGTVGQSPAFMGVRIVKNNMGNIPERQTNAQHVRTPYSSQPITFYFK